MKTNRNGIESFMRIIRNVAIMASVVLMAIIVMPKSVWARSLTVSPSSMQLYVGESGEVTLTYALDTGDPTGDTISWSTSGSSLGSYSPSNGSVPASGNKITFTALGEGTTTITVTIKDNTGTTKLEESCAVTVSNKALTITPSPAASMEKNASVTLTASGVSPYSPDLSTATWSIVSGSDIVDLPSTPTGASISVTGKKVGSATVRVTDVNNVSKTIDLTVTGIPATAVSVKDASSATSGTIDLSTATKTKTLTATLTPTDSDSPITWSSSDGNVASVSGSGSTATVTGVGGGTATITATANGNTATYSLTVNNPLTSIAVDKTSATIGIGGSGVTVTATPTPAVPYPSATYAWSTSNASVATVTGSDTTATIKGVAAGTATITVTPNGDSTKAKTIAVTVTPNVTDATTLSGTYLTNGYSRDMTKMLTIAPSTATYKSIAWTSSNTSVATIDSASGVVTGKSTGDTTITALITNQDDSTVTKTATLTVAGTPSITYNSDRTLSVSLPSKIATGSDDSVNISDVKGGYIVAFIDGKEVANTSSYQTSGTSFTVPASFAEGAVSNNQSKFSDEKDITFRVYPYGVKASDSGSKTRNDSACADTTGRVYKVTVSGTGIKTAYTYALNGTSIKITATPESNYTFSKWSDSTTTNPRTITVSGSTTYTAEATSKSSSSNSSSSSGSSTGSSKSSGSGAGYDKVPKTGEGNALMCMWILLAVSMIVAGGAVFIALNPNVIEKIGSKKNNK